MDINLLTLIPVSLAVGAAAGYLGSFMVLKRMSLVGDALSHVALPGMAIALALNYSPTLGAFLALTLAVIGIWFFEKNSSLYPETLVGIFFTASLAIGVLITPEPDLLEALFGSIEKINFFEGIAAVLLSLAIIYITHLIKNKIILSVISDELAKSTGVNAATINFVYLFLVGTIVALGVRFVGTLLMGALVIIPAASAKNISLSLKAYHFYSVVFGVFSAVVGTILATTFRVSSGPAVVLIGIFIFFITYLIKQIKN